MSPCSSPDRLSLRLFSARTEGPTEIEYNTNFLFLKTHRANYVSVSFLSDVAFKTLLTTQGNKFLFDGEIQLQIAYSFFVGFSHTGRELQTSGP